MYQVCLKIIKERETTCKSHTTLADNYFFLNNIKTGNRTENKINKYFSNIHTNNPSANWGIEQQKIIIQYT